MAADHMYQKLAYQPQDSDLQDDDIFIDSPLNSTQSAFKSNQPTQVADKSGVGINPFDDNEGLDSLDVAHANQPYEVNTGALDIGSMIRDLGNKSDMKMAFFNMANSILGAGVIGQPLAFKNCGLVASLICLVLLTILVDWTLRLIIINSKLSGRNSYQGTVEHCFGFWGSFSILLAQGMFAIGGSLAFCVIIGDSIPHVVRSIFASAVESNRFVNFILGREMLILIFVTGIAYPLSLARDISKLAKASGFALVGMTIIVGIVIIRGPMMPSDIKGTISASQWFISGGIFKGISVISFALVCHHNTTFIFDSLKKPTLDRFSRLTHISCFISMIYCGVIGTIGYLTFRSETKGNILNNFPADDWVANIARFCFGLNMLTTLPLEVFVVREVLFDMYKLFKRRSFVNAMSNPNGNSNFDIQEEEDDDDQLPRKAHIIITSVLIFFCEGVALMTCNLGAILELAGSTSGSIMAYILPPACFWKMTHEGKTFRQNLPSYFCIAFGVTVMIISSTQTILDSVHDKSGGGHCVA